MSGQASSHTSGQASSHTSSQASDVRVGMACADEADVHASCLEELQVYQKALAAAGEVSAILRHPGFQRDRRLFDQLAASSAAVAASIAEGFGLGTDRLFANARYRSRGESKETRTHLIVAEGRRYISREERDRLSSRFDEIERMLTGLIRHLQREDRKHRG